MNTNTRLLIALGLAFAVTVPAHADCLLPSPPNRIPDGQTAGQQEMLTAMQTLKEYNGDVDTYLKCLEFERKQGHLTNADQDRLHNAAVETLTRIANKFNEQVRTFKSKNG
jgi:hypothetical protein